MTLRSYDLNTNIKSFSRRGFLYDTSAGKYYGLLDSLTVYYGGNQVRMVTDAVTTDYGHPAEYRDGEATWYEHNHDKNGNLVCDLDRGVTSIGYNILNLPEKVLLPGKHETYNIYDADGRKLRTVHIVIYDEVVTPGGETIIPADTLVRDYSGSHIYENGVLERTLTPTGYYSAADSEYCHYIKDYQGNNIAVVKADANGAPEVVSATLMYPFGGELTEMSATDRYRFGGKELDTRGGLFHYDFGARHYDPVLPMFNGYDRRAEKYYHLSPFAYCAGNPIRYVDPSGMEWKTPEDKALVMEIDLQLNKKIEDAAKKLAKINKKISENTKKNKNNDKNIKKRKQIETQLNELRMSKSEIAEMGETKEKIFTFTIGNDGFGKTTYILNSPTIMMIVSSGYNKQASAVHELTHAYDFWKGHFQNSINDEVKAYRRQYAFKSNSMPAKIPGSILDIDTNYVRSIVDENGEPLYKDTNGF